MTPQKPQIIPNSCKMHVRKQTHIS